MIKLFNLIIIHLKLNEYGKNILAYNKDHKAFAELNGDHLGVHFQLILYS